MYCRQTGLEVPGANAGMIGGPNVTVEVDEAKFGCRKFHQGKRMDVVWIFECVEQASNFSGSALVNVPDQSETTLFARTQRFICLEPIIYSDCRVIYTDLVALGHSHTTMNHSKNLKYPITRIHTNDIKALWNKFRVFS